MLAVTVNEADGMLDVALCGQATCAAVRVLGAADGDVGLATRTTATNSASADGPVLREVLSPDLKTKLGT